MHSTTNHSLVFVAIALLASVGFGQATYVYDVTSFGAFEQHYLDSAAYPDGTPSPVGLYPAPSAGALGLAVFPLGAMASDDTTTTIYSTDGFAMAMDLNFSYVPFVAPGPPTPLAPIVLPPFWAGISGLAVDSVGGVLWAGDPFGSFAPYPLVPPFVPLAAPILIPSPAVGVVPMVGLGYESSTGTLWSVDAGGAVFNFTIAGVPVGPQPVVVIPSAVGFLFNGITVNTTNGPGALGAPPCSAQTGSQHVVITDGVFIYDAVPGIAPPMPILGGSGLGTVGLAYSSDPQILPGFAGCPTTGAGPMVAGSTMPNYNGPGAFNGLTLTGAPPLSTVVLVADLCPIPGGALLGSGETLWISPLSPTFAIGGALTDAAGTAVFPLSWVPVPAGLQFSCQFAAPDPAAPLGVCLSDAITVTVGLP
ncbi:MAG: hypothetical protein V3W41_04715 [Planctomycetota bacterium]